MTTTTHRIAAGEYEITRSDGLVLYASLSEYEPIWWLSCNGVREDCQTLRECKELAERWEI